ncbi:MAG: hypothetical protein ACLUNZ_05590 [Evtepia sp.]
MDSASCSPDCDRGAAMTGQAFSTRQAGFYRQEFRVAGANAHPVKYA